MVGRETIERIRQQAPLADVVGETVKLQRRGRSLVGLCPFHQERTGSLHVSPERGFFCCHGCGASGDVIEFVRRSLDISAAEAMEHLAGRAGVPFELPAEAREAHERRHALFSVSEAAASFFEEMLRQHPLHALALEELERRGLRPAGPTDTIADTLQAFRLGYAPPTWDALAGRLREVGASVHAAEEVGLLVPRRSSTGHYDRFRHRLMFAVTDLRGRVIAFSGRALRDPSAAELDAAGVEPLGTFGQGEAAAKYINSPESPIYRKREAVFGLYQARHAVREQGGCVLVEGNFDVVGLHARGIRNAVAPLGTAFTTDQARLIKRFAPEVVFMFDPDSAGRRAVTAAREACLAAGLRARVATLPAGQDPDEHARAAGADGIRRVLGLAQDLLSHLVDTLLDADLATDDIQARATKIRRVAELLASEEDPIVSAQAKQHADRVAERLGIADARTFRELAAAVEEALAPHPADGPLNGWPWQSGGDQAAARSLTREVGRELLGILLDYPELLAGEDWVEAVQLAEVDVAEAIDALQHSWDGEKGLDLEQLLAKLPASIHPFAAARLAAPRHERLEDARSRLLENIGKLNRLQLRCSSSEVEELQRAAAAGDFDQELALLREHERRARKRHGL